MDERRKLVTLTLYDKMRARLLLMFICVLPNFYLFGQQRPHYTQYVINPFIINPAIAGIDNYTDLKVSARDQWVGLKGAPRTSYVTIHAPLGKNDYRISSTSFEVPGNNPRGKSYWENYTAAEPHHGVGISVINDRTGSFNFFSASASYAYHLGLNSTTNLSAGLSAGVSSIRIDRSSHDFSGNGDPSDPVFGSTSVGEIKKIKPQMAAGIWLYARSYFIGLSAQEVIPQSINFVNGDPNVSNKSKIIPHLFFTTGYRFMVGEDFNLIPSIMIKYIRGSTSRGIQPELNTKFQYRDVLWVGGSYRFRDSYSGMIGLNLGNSIMLSYSYDLPISGDIIRNNGANVLSPFHNGTHELVIGFLIGNRYSEKCPRCF